MLIEQLRKSRPFGLIAGLNVIQTYQAMYKCADSLSASAYDLGLEFVFKASFDKANRTVDSAFRGPGIERGLELLSRLKHDMPHVQIVTDVHETRQCEMVKAAGLDLIQIPAFLCRQTDLIHAAVDTGLPILLKKGKLYVSVFLVAPFNSNLALKF